MKKVRKEREEHAVPGVVIAALRGGAGKTIFSVGVIAALCRQGLRVAPFKKGPDYIDAGWLALAAGRPCYNLDTFLVDSQTINESFYTHTEDADFAVIEGNRGLYDCIDTYGQTSTAELAKLLDLPVILCIDGTKTTRTMAAVVAGCAQFDPEVKLAGVVLNRVAGPRHEGILRDSIEYHCGIPVLGAVPRQRRQCFPERHMGLVPTHEHDWAHDATAFIRELASNHLDINAIREVAAGTHQWRPGERQPQVCADIRFAEKASNREPVTHIQDVAQTRISSPSIQKQRPVEVGTGKPRIGIIRDSAFQFYYLENLNALEDHGAELVFTSPLTEEALPPVDALYIGGGFPETHAARLARNRTYARHIRTMAEQGLPIYAECGGLMYLGRELVLEEGTYSMTGVLPIVFGFSRRPQGHGYTILTVARKNPFYETGQVIKGHEFHYSKVLSWQGDLGDLAFDMQRGTGLVEGREGLCRNNVLATYTHIHALGTPQWAPAMIAQAVRFRNSQFEQTVNSI